MESVMDVKHRRCAGLDVHQKEIVACRRLIVRRKVVRGPPFFDGDGRLAGTGGLA